MSNFNQLRAEWSDFQGRLDATHKESPELAWELARIIIRFLLTKFKLTSMWHLINESAELHKVNYEGSQHKVSVTSALSTSSDLAAGDKIAPDDNSDDESLDQSSGGTGSRSADPAQGFEAYPGQKALGDIETDSLGNEDQAKLSNLVGQLATHDALAKSEIKRMCILNVLLAIKKPLGPRTLHKLLYDRFRLTISVSVLTTTMNKLKKVARKGQVELQLVKSNRRGEYLEGQDAKEEYNRLVSKHF